MSLLFILFFVGIGLYLLASILSIVFYVNKKINIAAMICSILASVTMIATVVTDYIRTGFESADFSMFGNLFNPLKMDLRTDSISMVFLLIVSISSVIITVYIYVATLKGDIGVNYYKSSFLTNLFMIILSLIIFANQSYFMAFLVACAIFLVFTMLASDFENETAARRATLYLIFGNISVILIMIGYALILKGSGMLSLNGFEVALVTYDIANIAFLIIMAGFIVLLGMIPRTDHNHIRLIINGLFSKILLFILFRYVVNLFTGNISLIAILILLALGLISVFYNSFKASTVINGFDWLRYVDLALNSLCFISIIFSFYADNLGYSLIADQIRVSTYVMILCSIVFYPAITILIQGLSKVDKSKRFKLLALTVFVPKSLLPPIGGFAGIFIIISNISAMLDLNNFLKTLLLLASVFGLVYVYLFYVYAHMKFFVNVIDSGYEPDEVHSRRKLSKANMVIILFSVALTFITGFVPSAIGYGVSITYNGQLYLLVFNIIIMLLLVYFLNSTQTSKTFDLFKPAEIKKAIAKDGLYHIILKTVSLISLFVAGTFFTISHLLIPDGVKSYSILGVMYIIISVFLRYDKDIDFKDLYLELYMMLAIIVDAVTVATPGISLQSGNVANVVIDIIMAVIYLVLTGYAINRQNLKVRDGYDRILANAKMYIYITFFITYYANFNFDIQGIWQYVVNIVLGIIIFVAVYILTSILYIKFFKSGVKNAMLHRNENIKDNENKGGGL